MIKLSPRLTVIIFRMRLLISVLAAFVASGCTQEINEIEDDVPFMKDGCVYVREEVCGSCETKYQKDCTIHMEEHSVPVKVEECTDQLCNGANFTKKCYTQYQTQCGTNMKYLDVEEDYPVCEEREEEECTDKEGCQNKPVVKCRVDKKTVRKGLPETSCERVPVKMCRKEKCEKKKCQEKVVMQRSFNPREKCELKEQRVCEHTGPVTCRLVSKKYCDNEFSDNPAVNKTIMALMEGRLLDSAGSSGLNSSSLKVIMVVSLLVLYFS